MTTKLSVNNITPETISFLAGARITSVRVSNDIYAELDDLDVDVNGGYIIIRGANFSVGCQVSINGTPARSITRVSSTELRVEVPAQPTGTYPVEVINADGSTAILVNGITYSPFPAWSTGSSLSTKASDTLINIPLSASEANSAPVTYSLPGSNTLPTGLTLYSNGYIQGRMTANSNATYNFAVSATDPQNQNALRDFSLPIIQGGGPVWLSSQPDVLQKAPIARFYGNVVTATDPTDTIAYSVTSGSLPPGLTLDPITGLISGFASSFDNGNVYNFTVGATDTVGYVGNKNMSITLGDTLSTLLIKTANSLYPVLSSNNHAFVDQSTNNIQLTRNGTPSQGTFSPFNLNGWSIYLDGSSTFTPPAGLQTAFAGWGGRTRSFDGWIYRTDSADFSIQNAYAGVPADGRWSIHISSGQLVLGWTTSTGTETGVATTASIPMNRWSHISVTVDSTNASSTTIYLGIDGVVQTFSNNDFSTQTSSYGWNNIFEVTQYKPATFKGYCGGYRWSDNLRYTSNYTVPAGPFVNDANTLFLFGQSNNFKDSSSNNYTISVSAGAPIIQPNSPFVARTGYDTTIVGGSGFFDGSGDFIAAASNAGLALGTGAFTIECFFYTLGDGSDGLIGSVDSGSGAYGATIYFNDATTMKFGIQSNAVAAFESGAITYQKNAWNHAVLVRDASGNCAAFLNGARVASGTSSQDITRDVFHLGKIYTNINGNYRGYLSSVRIVKGTAVYNPTLTTLTVPTSPLTAIANTQLLVNFINAGLIDITGNHVLETSGGAVPYVGESKYGTDSIFFDGTGVVKVVQAGVNRTPSIIGTQDFTLETWMKLSAHDDRTIFGYPNSNAGGVTLLADALPGRRLYMGNSSNDVMFVSGGFPTGEWCHVAVTREGSNLRLLQNCTILRTVQDSTNLTGNVFQLGAGLFNNLSGYIDDPRITIGLARYTSNTTPPLELTYNNA